MKIYLDNGASTKADPKVVKVMNNFLAKDYGNASSLHGFGQKAKLGVEKARKIVADSLKAKPKEIIFTSGGTESDNLAIKGVALVKGKGHIITSKIEHPAVLNTCKELEKQGFSVTDLNVDEYGIVDLEQLKKSIRKDTILISIMHANNEIGTIEPIKKIYEIAKKNKILFHTDAVQSYTKIPLDSSMADLITLSSHKIHGPKGMGALYVKTGIKLKPLFNGGSQENKLRPGTENVPAIAGFAKAVELNKRLIQVKKLRDKLIKGLLTIPGTRLNGHPTKRLVNNVNISFDHVEGESVLFALNDKGIAVSTGSACSSESLEPSHVLMALGLKHEQAHGAIRFTLSKFNTEKEINYVIKAVKEAVKKLRGITPNEL